MDINAEMQDFADVMNSRMRSYDNMGIGINNHVQNITIDGALEGMTVMLTTIREALGHGSNDTAVRVNARRVLAKTLVVDMANYSMILYSKL